MASDKPRGARVRVKKDWHSDVEATWLMGKIQPESHTDKVVGCFVGGSVDERWGGWLVGWLVGCSFAG